MNEPEPPPSSSDGLFSTADLQNDLRGRSIRGGSVTVTAQAFRFALQMLSTVVLARLLTPVDFGLIAMVASITGFVELFMDLGLSMATVQREHVTHDQVTTLFWINVTVGAGLMVISSVSGMAKKTMGESAFIAVAVMALGNAGGRIIAVGTNAATPAGATVIDGTGMFVYPGFINAGKMFDAVPDERKLAPERCRAFRLGCGCECR
jgi:O-antigen/teichoic acid export membrane protein